MTPWLEIAAGADGCQVNLVRPGDLPPDLPGLTLPVLSGISSIQRPLSIPGIAAAPTSNMDAELDSAAGALTRLLGAAPTHAPRRTLADGGGGCCLMALRSPWRPGASCA